MNGLYSDTVKDRINQLELQKSNIKEKIDFLENRVCLTRIPTKDFLLQLISKDMGIKNKSLDDMKRIIKTYVKKVVVYPDHVDIYSEVDTGSGAEGNRTP